MVAVRAWVVGFVRVASGVVALAALLAAVGCAAPVRGPDGPGKLSLALPRAVGVYAGVETWRLVGDGPSGEGQLDQYLDTVDTDVTLEGLELGAWSFTLEGLDPDGTALWRARGDVQVAEGANTLELTLVALSPLPTTVEPLAAWDFTAVGEQLFSSGTLLPATGTVGGNLRVNGNENIETFADPTFGIVLRINSSYCSYEPPAGQADINGRTGDWTVMAWVYPHSNTSGQTVFGGASGSGENGLMACDATSPDYYGGLVAGSTEYEFTAAPSPYGAWQHMAWVKTAAGVRLFVNGVDAGLAEGEAQSLALPFAVVGGANGGANLPFSGRLAGIRVYGAALSTTQVIADAGLSPGMFAGGAGTVASPYLVSTTGQLDNVRHVRNAQFKQTQGLTLTGTWVPIGTAYAPFRGAYDGNTLTLGGLVVSSAGFGGLFGATDGATIRRLTLAGTATAMAGGTDNQVGLVVGRARNSALLDLYVSGSVSSSNPDAKLGGLAGTVVDTAMSGCSSEASVDGTSSTHAGGLAGAGDDVVVNNCQVNASVRGSGMTKTGGLFGELTMTDADVVLADVSFSGKVSGGDATGGLVGNMVDSGDIGKTWSITTALVGSADIAGAGNSGGAIGNVTVSNSLSLAQVSVSGTVLGTEYAGGILGRVSVANPAAFSLTQSSATGTITATNASSTAGGLVAYLVTPPGGGAPAVTDSWCYGTITPGSAGTGGGIVGTHAGAGGPTLTLDRVWASVSVTAGTTMEPVLGSANPSATITNAYYDKNRMGTSTSGTGLQDAARALISNYVGIQSSGSWSMDTDCFPRLAWQAAGSAPRVAYAVGDTGPAGGIVFYDQGTWTGGWRYLEAGLVDLDVGGNPYVQFGGFGITNGQDVTSTQATLGSGPSNTAALVAIRASDPYTASVLADKYLFGGYSDWFLPARDELGMLYTYRASLSALNLSAEQYWSSTDTANDDMAVTVDLSSGNFVDRYHSDGVKARPVRRF